MSKEMNEKIITLAHGERIIAVVPERCSGPGWTNFPTWVYILSSIDGTCRTECIQPRERSPALMHLFDIGSAVCESLRDAISVKKATYAHPHFAIETTAGCRDDA